jgi:hypothetical protein
MNQIDKPGEGFGTPAPPRQLWTRAASCYILDSMERIFLHILHNMLDFDSQYHYLSGVDIE